MKKWIQKAIVQKTISFLPFSHKINYIFQKYVTKGVYLTDAYFYDRLEHAREHLFFFKKYTQKEVPASSLEIGTGWYPTVPLAFFLAGTDRIYSVDISFLTSKERMKTTIQKVLECHAAGKLSDYIAIRPDRLKTLQNLWEKYEDYTLEQVFEQLHIVYMVEDARQLSLPDDSIELVNSNNTFEHIYPTILIPILREFKRVLQKKGGIMSHFIDMSDHFAHFDKSISIYNFLKYSDKRWAWIDNNIQPQNRLRIYEYEAIYADLEIPITEKIIHAGNLDELNVIPLAEKYQQQDLERMAVSHCHFISKAD